MNTTEHSASRAEFALAALVAAGHVSQELVDRAMELPGAPPHVPRAPLTQEQITNAAKRLAECMDYPWEFMPEQGRDAMRKHAQAVIQAAHGITTPDRKEAS